MITTGKFLYEGAGKEECEREIVYNVHKFMETESEVGITIPLSKAQRRVAEATRVSRRTSCRVLKEGENVETGVAMAFQISAYSDRKSAIKVSETISMRLFGEE